jgi:hypothetical protein
LLCQSARTHVSTCTLFRPKRRPSARAASKAPIETAHGDSLASQVRWELWSALVHLRSHFCTESPLSFDFLLADEPNSLHLLYNSQSVENPAAALLALSRNEHYIDPERISQASPPMFPTQPSLPVQSQKKTPKEGSVSSVDLLLSTAELLADTATVAPPIVTIATVQEGPGAEDPIVSSITSVGGPVRRSVITHDTTLQTQSATQAHRKHVESGHVLYGNLKVGDQV